MALPPLTPEQRQAIVLPFDDPLRSKVDANWHITPARIGKNFTPDQQAMITEIFRGAGPMSPRLRRRMSRASPLKSQEE